MLPFRLSRIREPNAGAHLLPEAGGSERTLEAVRCSAWLGSLCQLERHTVVPNIDVICHFQRVD